VRGSLLFENCFPQGGETWPTVLGLKRPGSTPNEHTWARGRVPMSAHRPRSQAQCTPTGLGHRPIEKRGRSSGCRRSCCGIHVCVYTHTHSPIHPCIQTYIFVYACMIVCMYGRSARMHAALTAGALGQRGAMCSGPSLLALSQSWVHLIRKSLTRSRGIFANINIYESV
jgi:hypothetical protein